MIEKTEYKGNPMLSLKSRDDDKFPFTFGLRKARLIMEHLEEIRLFIEENQK
jgi:hypothetical protein